MKPLHELATLAEQRHAMRHWEQHWKNLVWRLLEHAPAELETLLHVAWRHLAPLFRWRVPLFQIYAERVEYGHCPALVVGTQHPTIDYLLQSFVGDQARWEAVGAVPLIALPHSLRGLEQKADLIIARVNRAADHWFSAHRYLRVPETIGALVDLAQDVSACANKTARNNTRIIQSNGLSWFVSNRMDDFDFFYDEMYLPYIKTRYGHQMRFRNRYHARRDLRLGCLIWILRGEERIAGAIVRPEGSVLHSCVLGTAQGSVEPLRLGAVSAFYLFGSEYARQIGLHWFDLGASLPFLQDSVLRHKHSWGATLADRGENHHDLLIRWSTWNDRVAAFLAEVPLIFREGEHFAAITAHLAPEPADPARLWKRLGLNGIRRLYVVSAAGWRPHGLDLCNLGYQHVWAAEAGPPEVLLASARPAYRDANSSGPRV